MYVAEDVVLRRRVAIKVLHPALASDAAFLRRFRAEAQAVASLRHPNILTVFDWGEDDGSPYLVMELLEGGSLRSMLDRGFLLSPGQAATVGGDAARALDYAHRRGLVHRDIKPANLIFDDEGRVRVADFGLARALAEATWTEPAGAVVGTARYAAPEQVRGVKLDNRADVYSLAVMLVEATTGTVPFAADTTLGTLMARIEHPLVAPDEVGPLRSALEQAGTIDPADRLDAGAFAIALDKVAAALPAPAPLPLISPLISGEVERDEISPTEYPGRTRLFDVDAVESAQRVDTPHGARPTSERPSEPQDASTVDLRETPTIDIRSERPEWDESPDWEDLAAPEVVTDDRPRRKRRGLALVALVILLLAGVGGAAYAVASKALVPSHPVPTLLGDTQSRALATLGPLHFHLIVTGESFSATRPTGQIISQTPNDGKLKQGSTISVVISEGPAPVAVPGVTGDTQAKATAALAARGLKLGKVNSATSLTVPAGEVISQTPARGDLIPGQSVAITVSVGKPKVVVPHLSGAQVESYSAAQAALAADQLQAVDVPEYSNTVPAGQVIITSPAPGASIPVGSQVTVEVSKGPQLIAVPNVYQDTATEAAQALQGDGFVVSGTEGSPTNLVTGTNPAQGTEVPVGSSIVIITG